MKTFFISDRLSSILETENAVICNQETLNTFKGNTDYCILYETTYIPNINGNNPWLYSGSSWRNNKGYVGSLTSKIYKDWWKYETAVNHHHFRVDVLLSIHKSSASIELLKDIEFQLQQEERHADLPCYFNVNTNRGGPGMTSDHCLALRQKDPEFWKKLDIETAKKAAETKSMWTPERKAAYSDKMSKAAKGRKNHWNKNIRQFRPKCIYFSRYTINYNSVITVVDTFDGLRKILKSIFLGKSKTEKISPENLIKKKKCLRRGIELIKMEQVNTESGNILVKYESTNK